MIFLGIVKNLVQLRTEGLTLCRQGQKKEAKELLNKEGLRVASMTYISQKNIIFIKTNKKGMTEKVF